jgi:hypothetical protein
MTATSNSVFTAAQFNTYVRDNLNETAPAKASAGGQIFVSTAANAIAARTPTKANVDTSETTASATPADLTTPGPAVTVTTGTQAVVIVNCRLSSSSASFAAFASFAISGATTTAADVQHSGNSAGTSSASAGGTWLMTLTAGSNTFTMKYWTSAGGSTGTFSNRYLVVIPL